MQPTITDLITQIETDQVSNNDIDKQGNKIKLKATSYQNLVAHVKNVPYQKVKGPKLKKAKVNMSEDVKDFTLTPKAYLELLEGKSKPINIKEAVFARIDEEGSKGLEEANRNIKIDTPSEIMNSVENENPELTQQFAEIRQAKEQVQNTKEEAQLANEEAAKSYEEVNRLSVEQAEMEKKLEDAKARKQMVQEQVRKALEQQAKILKQARKKYETELVDANRRKEENQNKMIEFQTKIDENRDKLIQEEAEISKQQELLTALTDMMENENIILMTQPELEQEEVSRKVA